MSTKKRIAILISGRGSNMKALINSMQDAHHPAKIVCVISDRETAQGLGIAKNFGIPTCVISRKSFLSNEEHEAAVEAHLEEYEDDFIVLAGYMRLLTKNFIDKRKDKIINIHPALLPAFKGLKTHERALEAGVRIHGCTVHFVSPEMDEGPIIAQGAVPVLPSDTHETLGERVLKMEHTLYPLCVKWIAEGKIYMKDGKVVFNGFENNNVEYAEKGIFCPL